MCHKLDDTKNLFCFFFGGHCEGREDHAFDPYYLLWNQTSALTRHMFINHNDKSIISPKVLKKSLYWRTVSFWNTSLGGVFFCVKRVGLKVPNMCHGGAEICYIYYAQYRTVTFHSFCPIQIPLL